LTIVEPASGDTWKIAFSSQALEMADVSSLVAELDSIDFQRTLQQSRGRALLVYLGGRILRYHVLAELPKAPARVRLRAPPPFAASGDE
jgi:hypothetical protein